MKEEKKKKKKIYSLAYSIDVSQAMVDYAKKKASESNVSNQMHVIVGDMRSLNTNKNLTETDFECTSILLGTIGHILTHEDCKSTLTSQPRHAKSNPIFPKVDSVQNGLEFGLSVKKRSHVLKV